MNYERKINLDKRIKAGCKKCGCKSFEYDFVDVPNSNVCGDAYTCKKCGEVYSHEY